MLTWIEKLSQENEFLSIYNDINTRYPIVSGILDGLSIIDDIPNIGSIRASLGDESNYEILKGIRSVPISDILEDPKHWFYAANDFHKFRTLAQQINTSKQIKPVIVAVEKEGPHVLEGIHRCAALFELKIPHVPALVVINYSSYS